MVVRWLSAALQVLGWAIIVALPISVIWLCVSSVIAKNEAQAVVQQASAINDAAATGDSAALRQQVDELADHIDAAWAQTSQPIWWAVEQLPYVGQDVGSVRQVVDVLHDVSVGALPHVSQALGKVSIQDITISDGTISVPGLADAADDLSQAATVVTRADADMQRISDTHYNQINVMLDQAKDQFDTVSGALDSLARLAKVMPSMLDMDGAGGGQRTYVVIAQNNAELRATGGIPGSVGLLHVSNGKISLDDFVSDSEFDVLDSSVLPLTAEEKVLFSARMGRWIQDVTFTPDFSRTGEFTKAMWERQFGGTIDGVISVDPVLLQNMLAVTGAVTASDGQYTVTLDGTNTAQILLSQVYQELPVERQDAFFSLAASAAFATIMHGDGHDPVALAKAFINSARNGHFYVWSAHEDEEQVLEGTTVGGTLAQDASNPVAGLFFNDSAGSKMGWYLKRDVAFAFEKQLNDGRRQYVMDVTLTNTLDPSQVDSVPDYVLGMNVDGTERGDIGEMLYVYAPAGGRLLEWQFDDGSDFDMVTLHDGLTLGAKTIKLKPGESMHFVVRFLSSPEAADTPMLLRQTPTAQE